MAKRLEDQQLPPRRTGGPRKYPWESWADGSVWRVVKDRDFTCDVPSFRTNLKAHARRHGLKVESRRDGDALTFRFSPRV